jgi:hypothetical protein
MPNPYDATPSSLRKPIESSRFTHQLAMRNQRPVVMASGAARVAVLSKSRFARLPHEPEDARLTGVTRSLNRRLLALNVSGSLVRIEVLSQIKIA